LPNPLHTEKHKMPRFTKTRLALLWLSALPLYSVFGSSAYCQVTRPDYRPPIVNRLKVNDPSAAKANVNFINGELAAHPPRTVQLPPSGMVYLDGTIKTRAIDGCGRFKTDGCFGYGGIDSDHPTLGGATLTMKQIGKCTTLRICGAGFVADDPIFWDTDEGSAIIEVEGRGTDMASGRHRFRNQVFNNAAVAIRCLAEPEEAHADMSIVDGCECFNIGTFFESRNQQAFPWSFRDCAVNILGKKPIVIADLWRSDTVFFDRLTINHPYCTIFRLHDYSPNNCRLVCSFIRDRPDPKTGEKTYLTLVDYAGPKAAKWMKWSIDVNGWIPTYQTKFDEQLLYRNCNGLPRDDWHIEIKGIVNERPAVGAGKIGLD
jgi:hypothetical protein